MDHPQTQVVARAGLVHLRHQGDRVEIRRSSTLILVLVVSWSSKPNRFSTCAVESTSCYRKSSTPSTSLLRQRATRDGAAVKAYLCTLCMGVYLKPIDVDDPVHKYYCLASPECRNKKHVIPCKKGDRSNVNSQTRRSTTSAG